MEAATVAATSSLSLVLPFSSPRRRSPAAGFLRCSPASARPPLPPPPCSRISCHSTSTAKQQQQQPWLTSDKGSTLSLRCSSAATDTATTVVSSERWILEPAGDGDWRHIGYSVPRPGAIEIASSDAVTVGRVPEKADIVIPVATVSGVHARLEMKDGSLVVTDMDSTNGTYINERKLVPGFGVAVQPGSLLIFGDIHLAMFRVRKMIVDVPSETSGDGEQVAKTEVVSSVAEETS